MKIWKDRDIQMVFIWVENDLWKDVLEIFESWSYKYVDSMCWVKKWNDDNYVAYQTEKHIMKNVSISLLIFHKLNEVCFLCFLIISVCFKFKTEKEENPNSNSSTTK
jgi:N6-adenosine-specific RNA methylase IME4